MRTTCVLLLIMVLVSLNVQSLRVEASPPPPPPPPPPGEDPPPPTIPPGENATGGGGGGGCGGSATDNVVVIVVDVGEFSQGTNPPVPTGTRIPYDLVNGVAESQSVGIVSVSDLPFLQQQNMLINAGEIDPATAVSYSPYAGYGVGYSVSVTEHLSGDPNSPYSVGTVTVTVKDAQGNVVFTNQVTSQPGWGGAVGADFAPLEEQAGGNLNAFFNSVITDECPPPPSAGP